MVLILLNYIGVACLDSKVIIKYDINSVEFDRRMSRFKSYNKIWYRLILLNLTGAACLDSKAIIKYDID